MERLIWHLLDELRVEYEVHAIGPRGSAALAPKGVEVTEVAESPLWRFLFGIKWKAIGRAFALKPRVILAGSGLTTPFAWFAARLVGAKAVVYLHGLDIEATHGLYRALWLPFIRRCDLVLTNSRFTKGLALDAGVSEDRIEILHPGVALPDLTHAGEARKRFRERYDLGDRAVMLYVGRITERKGLAPFVEHCLPDILHSVPDAVLVVIGEEPRQALMKGGSLMERINRSLTESGLQESVRFLGSRPHDHPEISEAYFAADVHVFPVQDRPGDNEGFGMVAIEAAVHGLPTVAFDAGGVGDAVGDGVSGALISPGNNAALTCSTIGLLQNKMEPEKPRSFGEPFAWEQFGDGLNHLLRIRR
jgi:phosphatidylinositol alpha-1,6-mannosyltransferase